MLTDKDRSLVRRVFSNGPSVLFDEGYDIAGAESFLERDEVKQEMSILTSELANQDALFARVNFTARRQLTRLVPGAIAILGQGLNGPIYQRDPVTGAILTDNKGNPRIQHPEVTDKQLRSANLVMDTMGLTGANKPGQTATVDLQLNLSLRPVTDVQKVVTHDPADITHEQRALSRERTCLAIDLLSAKLPRLQELLAERLSGVSKKPAKAKKELKPRALPSPTVV